jgi:hypothetical protein
VPPRFAYWTVLIDNAPTAFRAAQREELLPTLTQLRRTNPNAVMKWFARGRLWEGPEAAQLALRAPKARLEKRERDWRPGGEHKDPRARFDKKKQRHATPDARQSDGSQSRHHRDSGSKSARPWGSRPPAKRPWQGNKAGEAPRINRPWQDRERAAGGEKRSGRENRPWSGKTEHKSDRRVRRADEKTRRDNPKRSDVPRIDQPWRSAKAHPPGGKRPWPGKPGGRSGGTVKQFGPGSGKALQQDRPSPPTDTSHASQKRRDGEDEGHD